MLMEDHELIIKEFLAVAIGSICLFSFACLPIYLSGLAIVAAVRALVFTIKATIEFVVIKAMLRIIQTTIRIFSDLILRPFAPRMAVSLKFRTYQLCLAIKIGITRFLSDVPRDEEITDPTIYVYDPRGRTFQSFNPNWKPCLGSFKRKLDKKKYVKKIRQLQGRYDERPFEHMQTLHQSTCGITLEIPSDRTRPAAATTTPTSKGGIRPKGGRSPAPGVMSAATDSDTDNSSHGNTSLVEHHDDEQACNNELCRSFTLDPATVDMSCDSSVLSVEL